MVHGLEAPAGAAADWAQLYRSRGDEVEPGRPFFTGDVFEDSAVRDLAGELQTKAVMIVQHPCAMRLNGVDLVPGLLVAEVLSHQLLKPDRWTGFTRVMPLPDLKLSEEQAAVRHQAGYFNKPHIVEPEALGRRIASLSIRGVNLLLQRWVHHNSRVVVPTSAYLSVIGGVFEEADLIEEWCAEQPEVDTAVATAECVNWLRDEQADGGPTRQKLLEDEQWRSGVRKQMRQRLRELLRDQP